MRCGTCGSENPPGMRFCTFCGTSLLEQSGAQVSVTANARAEALAREPGPRVLPFGVVFIVVAHLVNSVVYLLVAWVLSVVGAIGAGVARGLAELVQSSEVSKGLEGAGALVSVGAVISWMLGLVMASAAVGLWMRSSWGRRVTVWAQVPNVLVALLGVIVTEGAVPVVIGATASVGFSIFCVLYLTRHKMDYLFEGM